MPADDRASVQCALDSATDEATSDVASETSDCESEAAQYQPDEPQYQPPASTTCGSPDESVAPIPEPATETPTPSTSGNVDSPASAVSPTAEPVTPVTPQTEPTQSGAVVLPAPDGPPPAATKIAASRPLDAPRRPSLASSRQASHAGRVIPAQVRSVSPSPPVRPRLVRAPSTKLKASVSRRDVEAAALQIPKPASPRTNLFGGWFLLAIPLSFIFGLGLILLAAAIAGRSLRARVGSKGLSDRGLAPRRRGGIRYRE